MNFSHRKVEEAIFPFTSVNHVIYKIFKILDIPSYVGRGNNLRDFGNVWFWFLNKKIDVDMATRHPLSHGGDVLFLKVFATRHPHSQGGVWFLNKKIDG